MKQWWLEQYFPKPLQTYTLQGRCWILSKQGHCVLKGALSILSFQKNDKTSWRNAIRDDGLLVLAFTLGENSNVSTDLRQVSVWNGCVSYTAVINDRFEALRGWICKRLNVGLTSVDILQRTEMGYALELWKDLSSTNHFYSSLRSSKSWYVHSSFPLIYLIENREESSVMKDFCSFPVGAERER